MEDPSIAETSEPTATIAWLLGEAKQLPSGPALLKALSLRLNEIGLPLARTSFHVRTLHPTLFGLGFRWYRGREEIEVFHAEHGVVDTDLYQRSPLRLIFDGHVDEIRQPLDLDEDRFEFPFYQDLKSEGFTDYRAFALTFSDGKTQATTWTTDREGGFTDAQIGLIKRLLPIFSLLIEIHLNRRIAINLLDTYVGRKAGERVLSGQITRGIGDSVEAAIWFSDLRGFTAMSESRGRDELLGLLNQYFDRMAVPVEKHGGEILKFIGDAVLAIFPLGDGAGDDACERALNAAVEAQLAMTSLNEEQTGAGGNDLACGIGLHVGEVMYGNIGSTNRLDFTVIGPAVNLTSRIEGMCRKLGQHVLISDDFSKRLGQNVPRRSLGSHQLAGVRREVELFSPDKPENSTA